MSTDVWDDVTSEDKIPRDRWGRAMVVPKDGGKPVPYTRVTTYAGAVEDMFGLGQWQQRMVALGLAKRADLLLAVSAHEDDKDELNRITEQAKEAAAASAAATTGTALHKLAERYDRGQLGLADVPESHRADLAAYVTAMGPLTIHGIEEFVVVDELKVAGTFDRIVEYQGRRYVADIKTGSIEYGVGKMSIQLALYAHGWLAEPRKAGRSWPGVEPNAGLIVHLPAGQGRCDLYWIDLKAGWEAARLCDEVRAWRKRKGLLAPAQFGDLILTPAENRADLASIEAHVTEQEAAEDGSTWCSECIDVGANEDPAPWCDCRHDETCDGPCRRRAHDPTSCPTRAIAALTEAFDATPIDPVTELIAAADSPDQLEQLWAVHRDTWTAEHTRLAADRKKALHQQALKDAIRV